MGGEQVRTAWTKNGDNALPRQRACVDGELV
jgi:hypothetical protein